MKPYSYIVHVTAFFPPHIGGIENYVNELTRHLSLKSPTLIMTTSNTSSERKICQNRIVISCKTWFKPMNNPIALGLLLRGIKLKPRIIHAHGLYQWTTLVAYILSWIHCSSLIVTMHGRPHYSNRISSFFLHLYEKMLVGKLLNRAKYIIALTRDDQIFLETQGVSRKKIRIIPNAVDTKFWKPGCKSPIDIDNNRPFILFVGNLIDRKNCRSVILEFPRILNSFPLMRLVIVGTGPEFNELVELVRMLDLKDSIEFLRNIDKEHLLSLYQKAAILIHPSKREGLPTVILESMSSSAIILSSNIEAVRNLITQNKNGFLFDLQEPHSITEMISCIQNLSAKEKQEIRIQARETILKHYDWSSVSKKVKDVYRLALMN